MPGYYYGFDWTYLVLVLPTVILALFAQMSMKSTFGKYAKVHTRRGATAEQVARRILDENGLHNVPVHRTAGNLTDHYDPRTKVVSLSDTVYGSSSVAAIGVAAHEVGHAVQHAEHYAPLKFRNSIVPVANIGSTLAMPLILIGMLMNSSTLAMAGVVLFSLVAVFQLVTLPVEFNASRRAVASLEGWGVMDDSEIKGTRKVLTAAALTYVAALLTSLAQLLRLVILVSGGRKRR